jgi:hypothetical protein
MGSLQQKDTPKDTQQKDEYKELRDSDIERNLTETLKTQSNLTDHEAIFRCWMARLGTYDGDKYIIRLKRVTMFLHLGRDIRTTVDIPDYLNMQFIFTLDAIGLHNLCGYIRQLLDTNSALEKIQHNLMPHNAEISIKEIFNVAPFYKIKDGKRTIEIKFVWWPPGSYRDNTIYADLCFDENGIDMEPITTKLLEYKGQHAVIGVQAIEARRDELLSKCLTRPRNESGVRSFTSAGDDSSNALKWAYARVEDATWQAVDFKDAINPEISPAILAWQAGRHGASVDREHVFIAKSPDNIYCAKPRNRELRENSNVLVGEVIVREGQNSTERKIAVAPLMGALGKRIECEYLARELLKEAFKDD